jgi:lauroyl/myristoyl acyltransferase
MRLVPRRRRFGAMLLVARALEPLLRRTTAYRRQATANIDGAREIAVYFVMRVLTRHGVGFDPEVAVEGGDALTRAIAEGNGVFLAGPHATLFHLLFRRLHDDGLAPAGITAEHGMRLAGTTIVAETMQPSPTFLLTTRDLLRQGRLVCGMLDRGDHQPGRTVEFETPAGPLIVAPALLRVAVRCHARVLFTEVHATRGGIVATIHEPSSDTVDGLTREFAEFVGAHIERRLAFDGDRGAHPGASSAAVARASVALS